MLKSICVGIFVMACCTFVAAESDATFLRAINDEGEGEGFDRPILLNNQCDFRGCENDTCAEKIYRETVFRQELEYVTSKFGRQDIDWQVIGQMEVSSYVFGVGRYYDDLSIKVTATGKSKTLHFDITSSVHAFRDKRFGLLSFLT